jgi:hypothetical protein
MTPSPWTLALLVLALTLPLAALWLALRRAREQAPYLFEDVTMYQLTLGDDGLRLHQRGGETQELAWSKIAEVRIRTSDAGPFAEDVFWEFERADGGSPLIVPNGATGVADFLETIAARLPGFDHGAVIEAMTCTEDRVFRAWPPVADN